MPWTLDRIRVKFNILHTELRRDNKQHGATPSPQCALNRLSAGIIFGTKTISGGGKLSSDLGEPGGVKLIEPQAGAEVKPLSVAHRKPGRSATARVSIGENSFHSQQHKAGLGEAQRLSRSPFRKSHLLRLRARAMQSQARQSFSLLPRIGKISPSTTDARR